MNAGHLCVVLHDVAPAGAAGCRALVARCQRVAAAAGVELPLTLLVVPCWHGDPVWPREQLRWLRALADAGHELVLHGFSHHDDGPPPRGPLDWLRRRAYTAGEGEFAALSRLQAESRLARAREWATACALPVRGFVAPAWLASEGARQAIAAAGFEHSCTLTRVVDLARGAELPARALVFSTRSAWRRALSLAWNQTLAHRQAAAQAPLMRFELHPGDMAHPAVLRCWTGLLRQALHERTPLRLGEAARMASAEHPALDWRAAAPDRRA